MNSDRKTRLQKAEKVRQYKDKRQSVRVSAATTPDSGSSSESCQTNGNLKSLLGECPPSNRAISWVCDPLEKKTYMVGGRRQSDESFMPTSDFYRLDIKSMRWTNLTDSLKFRDVDSLFSLEGCQREYRRIPALTLPGHTLFQLHGTSFLLLFGGYDADSEQVSSKLIVVDLRHLEWWYQPVVGGIATGRIDPTMVAIGRKLYVFGGYRRFGDDFGDPHQSYSIASLSDDGKAWSWEVCDSPYENIPPGTRLGRATTIYEGRKILLTTWRTTNDDCFNLGENDFFCYHIKRKMFQPLDLSGNFPENLDYYVTFPMTFPSVVAPSAKEVSNSHPGPSHVPHTPRSPSSAIICGWMDSVDSTLVAEVWHLLLTPIEEINKLDIAPIIVKLDSPLDVDSGLQAGLQAAVMLGEGLFLLGSRPKAQARNSDHLSRVFNTYWEVPLRRLCPQTS